VWDKFHAEDMKKLGFKKVHYMPIAANTKRFKKLDFNEDDAREYGADVSFVGSRTLKRERVLSALTDFDLAIWGYDWENAADERLRECARGAADNENELVKVYNHSKININVTVDQGVSSLNMRVFDCMASGGFLISDYKQDFDSLFDKGEAVAFRELDELPRMVKRYLERAEERMAIAEKGRLRVAADHSYSKRIEFIMNLLERDGMFARPRWWENMVVSKAGAEFSRAEAAV
jgi:spore maturation protein CgeB